MTAMSGLKTLEEPVVGGGASGAGDGRLKVMERARDSRLRRQDPRNDNKTTTEQDGTAMRSPHEAPSGKRKGSQGTRPRAGGREEA